MKRKREHREDRAGSPERCMVDEAKESTSDKPIRESAKNINPAIGMMDSRMLADYVAQRNRRFGEQLSPVEIEDVRIPGRNFHVITHAVHASVFLGLDIE